MKSQSQLEVLSDLRPAPSPTSVLAIVSIGIVLANLDLFSVNVALPKIAQSFQSDGFDELSWVLNGYTIAYAALLVFFGRLAEGYRRDRSFILGISIFGLASAACVLSNSIWQLVAFRVVAAAGAALMTPTSLGLLLAAYPPEGRAGAVRNWAAIGGIAAALGPLVGGLLVSFDWRLIYVVNVVICLVGISLALKFLPPVPGHQSAGPSAFAVVAITGGIASLIFAITKGNAWGWSSPVIIVCVGASVVFLVAFLAHSLRSSNPLIDPTLFRIRPFTGAALTLIPYSVSFGALIFSAADWGQTAWGWSALHAGLAMLIGPSLVPITSFLLTGKLIARFGSGFVVTAGLLLIIASFVFWTSVIDLSPRTLLIVIGMVMNGVGVGLAFPTLMGVSTQALPPSAFATGSGMINMLRQAAIAIGVAIFVAIIGTSVTAEEKLAAFRMGWIVMAVVTGLSLPPAIWLLNPLSRNDGERRVE